jgi:putative ABC transport system permease protein
MLVSAIGGGLGLGLAKLLTLRGDPTGGFLPYFHLPVDAVIAGMGLSLVVGLVAGFVPALSAGRLRVVDALRRI